MPVLDQLVFLGTVMQREALEKFAYGHGVSERTASINTSSKASPGRGTEPWLFREAHPHRMRDD